MMSVRLPIRLVAGCALLALTSATLVACGADKSADSSGEPVKITWLHRLPDKKGAKTVNELVEEFNQSHPNIQVTAETMQGSAAESYAKINSIVAAGKDVPCLAQLGSERVPDMVSSLQDVAEYTKQYASDYVPALYEKSKILDQVYGVPQGASPVVFYYRKDLFEQYGLQVPKTWSEYQQVAQQVREKSNQSAYLGAFLTDEYMWQSALSSSEGADWYQYDQDKQAWKVSIVSEQSTKVAEYWQQLVDQNLVTPIARWGQDFNKYLADGTIISTIGGAWEAPLIADSAPETTGNWAVAQIPHFEASTSTVGQNGGSVLAVLKGCDYPKESVEFAHWFTTNNEGLTGLGLLPPTQVSSLETPEQFKTFFGGQAIYDEFIAANQNAPQIHWAPQIAEMIRVFGDGLAKVGNGGTIAQAYQDAQDTALKSLTDAGAKVFS